MSRIAVLLLTVSSAIAQDRTRPIESILFPLGYGEGCWSSVTLQNVSGEAARVRLTAHKSSGALAPLKPIVELMPGAKVDLRLEVKGEDDNQAWVQMIETRTQSVALSGTTECPSKTTAAGVIFPSANPRVRGDVKDFPAKEIWILNASAVPASAEVCYSNGVSVQQSDAFKPTEICSDEDEVYLPPFGMRIVPIVKNGNSGFSMRTTGESVALRLLIPGKDKSHKFSVDSSIQFADIPPGTTR